MKYSCGIYPFDVFAETKKSTTTGKEYTAISIRQNSKDKNGEKTSTYFNLFDKRDLLMLSTLCNSAFIEISKLERNERFESKNNQKDEPKKEVEQEDCFDDEIPF